MRFIWHFLILAILTFLLGNYTSLPWWIFAPLAVLTGAIFSGSGWVKFLAAFLAIGSVWGGYAYYIFISEKGGLVLKVGQLLGIADGNPAILIFITALLGATLAGLSVWTGHSFRQIFERKRNDNILRRI